MISHAYEVLRSPASGLTYTLQYGSRPHGMDVLMLHGLSGDERSMAVLQGALGGFRNAISPRGLFQAAGGGFSWIHPRVERPPHKESFTDAIRALCTLIHELSKEGVLDPSRLILMGFSQGAATAFALAGEMANCMDISPAGLVAVAGFLPQGDLPELSGIPVYWGHGSRDLLIPAASAQGAVQRLQQLGVEVQYCEADVGHKLGVECTRGLKAWMEVHFNRAT